MSIHLNIAPSFSICTAGDPALVNTRCSANANCDWHGTCSGSPGSKTCSNTGASCTNASQCTVAGACTQSLECAGSTDVFVVGHTGTACTIDGDCNTGAGETCDTIKRCEGANESGQLCATNSDCHGGGTCVAAGLCQFADQVSATVGSPNAGQIDVDYTTRPASCDESLVAYCSTDLSSAFLANANFPVHSALFIPAELRTVDAGDNELDTPAACVPSATSCANVVGSLCCGLTQGAYGAPNSIATATSSSCAAPNLGFIPDAACQSCNVFAGDPNATLIGIEGTKAVSIGPDGGGTFGSSPTSGGTFPTDLKTLIAYLPAGGTPNKFSSVVGTDTYYSSPGQIPDLNKLTGGSKGEGGGALSGQDMTCGLNTFLSDCSPPFGGSSTFTASGFGGFTLPDAGVLVCTKRAGADHLLGSSDDIYQAFLYPTCVHGQTVAQVKLAADAQLASGSNVLSCSASDLTVALDNINNQFDGCGNVIDCGAVASPGVFTCP